MICDAEHALEQKLLRQRSKVETTPEAAKRIVDEAIAPIDQSGSVTGDVRGLGDERDSPMG